MNSNHEQQMQALTESKKVLHELGFPTYSVLLKMTTDTKRQGIVEAIRVCLDARNCVDEVEAKEREGGAAWLLQDISDRYGLPIETSSIGHAYVTAKPRSAASEQTS